MPDKNRAKSMNTLLEGITYASIIGMFALIYMGMTRTAYIRAEEEQANDLYRTQSMLATRIQQSVNKKLVFARGLAAAVSLSPDITEEEFTALCSVIKTEDESVVNMAIVQGTIITHVHPFDDNKGLLGVDLNKMPAQRAVLQEVERTGQTIIEGPTTLVQGYSGFIVREPIYPVTPLQDTNELFGVASVVFATDPFLAEVGLNEFSDDYNISLHVTAPFGEDVHLYGSELTADTPQITYDMPFPSTLWSLTMTPKAPAVVPRATLSIIQLSIGLATILALLFARYLHVLRSRHWRTAMQLQAALNAAPTGFVMFDEDDNLELCNRRYIELHGTASGAIFTGASLKSILRAGLKKGLYTDAIGNEEAWLEKQLSRDKTKGSTTLAMSNGTWFQLLEHKTPDGGRVAILNDITEVQCSRERATIAEQRLNDAINALPVGFWLFDNTDRLLMFNTVAGEKLDGMQRGLFKGRSLQDLVARRVKIADALYLGGERVYDVEKVTEAVANETSELVVCYAGNRWFQYYTRRTSEGGLVLFRVEITDLRRHQNEIEKSNAELRAALQERDEAETRLQDVADLSSEWFWEQDADMRITYLSDGFQRTMGVDPSIFIGKYRKEFMPSEENGQEETLEALHRKMAVHEPFRDIVYSYNFRPDELSWVRISGKPLFDAEGAFTGYIGTAEDVTKFYAALRKAEQADEAKTQFLNVISHELRTPLSAVLGFNSFVGNFEKLPSYAALKAALNEGDQEHIRTALTGFEADISRFTQRIQSSGTQLKFLIDDMLDLARIEADTMRINPDRIDSKQVIQSVVEQMHTLADEKGLEIKLELTEADIRADEIRFRQILTNILGNAFKFTDQGHITVSNRIQGNMAIFEIQDTGIGISEDRIGIVFDRFAQAVSGSTRSNQGVGLGLAICKDLAALQNGWIKAESELGIGTKMILALPLWDETEEIQLAP
ncbi:sensor histidine kinase [Celeribacter sp. ULVN23_4]